MSMLLRGAPAAAALNEKTAQLVSGLREKGVAPTLAIVRLGVREDDLSYERAAVKRCAAVGIETRCVSLPENVSGEALEETLRALSAACGAGRGAHAARHRAGKGCGRRGGGLSRRGVRRDGRGLRPLHGAGGAGAAGLL